MKRRQFKERKGKIEQGKRRQEEMIEGIESNEKNERLKKEKR